jgi:hypothetical protein
VAASLDKVRKLYCQQGFKMAITNANPKFETLQDMFGDISFNFFAQDEHIPEI